MIGITRRQRSLLLFLSTSGYIAWFSGVGTRLEAQGIAGPRIVSMTMTPAPAVPRVASQISRDPFAGNPQASHAAPPPDDAANAVPPSRAAAATNGADATGNVPNIAGADMPPGAAAAAEPMTLTVRATIVGRTSVAYVANGSAMDIVRVGDSLGDHRIVKIDLEGITFNDGSRLDLAAGYNATPAPLRRPGQTITIPLEQLRRLFSQTPATGAVAPVAAQSQAEPTAGPPQIATPAPLPTVNAAGVAPGTNPTPDLTDPTAYPYPYPYPPATHH
jgi:hypothetical protein